jgi:hypothetical protein
MAGPLIFISHNKDDAAPRAFRERLAEALPDAGFSTWADTDQLTPSDTWCAEIDQALVLCRGSVVLLSPPALGSKFVPYEISVLAHRRRMAPRFRC